MVFVHQLRPFAGATLEAFRDASGEVAFIQQPVDPSLQSVAQKVAGARTVGMAHRSRMAERLMAMLRDFDNLEVHFFKPEHDGQLFTVGREGCDLVVLDPSVSKHHATLVWKSAANTLAVRDAASMNGTWLNTAPLGMRAEVKLNDGDTLAFGDAQFLYLHVATLHEHLRLASPQGQ